MPASNQKAATDLLSIVKTILSFLKKVLQIFTIVLRYIWLLFPAFLFLIIAGLCFWNLSQGKDLLIASIEGRWGPSVLLIAIVFWVFTTWYSSRILVYKRVTLYYCGKDFFKKGDLPEKRVSLNWILYKCSEVIGHYLPRLLGYLCFSVVVLAYWQLPVVKNKLSGSEALYLLLVYMLLFIFLNHLFEKLGKWFIAHNAVKGLKAVYWLSLAVLILFVLRPFAIPFTASLYLHKEINYTFYQQNAFTIMLLITILQQLYLFVVVNRHQLMANKIRPSEQKGTFIDNSMPPVERSIRRILLFVNIPYAERIFFLVFNIISLIAISIYLYGVFSISFAMNIGSLNFAVLAFGILVGYFDLVSIFSIHIKVNFHIIILILVLVFGYTREPHYVRLVKKDTTVAVRPRPYLQTYFLNWVAQHAADINKSANYPVFFILADGGASRSGYWVASVLGKLHDETAGRFDNHLFCLSGASGGSVGNGAYMALLYNKAQLAGKSYEAEGQDFLRHDFLSFTLARMLGPDFFRPLLPINLKKMKDRAGALESVMEEGTGDTTFLQHKLAVPFSALTPDTAAIQLPVLCINTTRMQDGRPGVISNIVIDTATFGKRIDVLNLLPDDTDMRLSTAVVLGARFPYISPAGRIDHYGKDTSVNYFVDGGYFDNSGAGVVHEMIIGIQEIIKKLQKTNTPKNAYLSKLSFYVIHITNSPAGNASLTKVHPLQNDLMSPITTLVGSFGTQTDVNNSRLQKYLQLIYPPDTPHYLRADLYHGIDSDTLSFPMNWTISNYYQIKMKKQLASSQITQLINWVKHQVQ